MRNFSWGLACLLLLSDASAAVEAEMKKCRKLADPGSRLVCYDAVVLTPSEVFGLPTVPTDTQNAIESSIPGSFQGWGPMSRIQLANGQVWEVADGSRGVFQATDPRVVIRRGALGSFILEIEGLNRSARVRRIK